MAYLYKNVVGREVKAHSHSGGNDWSCPKKYYWKRIEGYQSREDRVATFFGRAIEDAIQFHHRKNFEPESGVDEFKQIWFHYKDDDTVQYSEKSGNWDDHYRMGVELLTLYEATVQEYPITNAEFQVEGRIELGDGLQYTAKADMVCVAPNNHPLLPIQEGGEYRKFLVDIKTSAYPYNADPRLCALDDQLRDYSWVFNMPTVSFLVLVKNFTEPEAGDWITVLRGPKVGKKYQVLDSNPNRVIVLAKSDYDDYVARKKDIKGKGSTEAKAGLLTEYFYKGHTFSKSDITKQRIQFLSAIISDQDRLEAKEIATQEAMEISGCSASNFFPKKPGVRFPHNPCISCECLGLCLGDKDIVKEKLIKIDGVF